MREIKYVRFRPPWGKKALKNIWSINTMDLKKK